ncbi:hypothetical protein [uncultured Limosilactobacillus sp.]|uniref:hypothetical protein n=1 Tax=uncultured Limosilactobacillus sp. TaxID=2837629 RepID=UPI0025EAACF2|nr:hypothetical protein [uncultured Limosilactobacillus sp.]
MVRIIKSPAIHYSSLKWLEVGIALYFINLIIRYLYTRLVHHDSKHNALVFAFGGIHGSVTFALAFMMAEEQIHQRDFSLIIMSESTLIILSMIIPTIVFQFILKSQQVDKHHEALINNLRKKMIDDAIKVINQLNISNEVKQAVSFDLRSQKGQTTLKEFWNKWTRMIQHEESTKKQINTALNTFYVVFQAERTFLSDNYQQQGLTTNNYNLLYRETINAEMVVLKSYMN